MKLSSPALLWCLCLSALGNSPEGSIIIELENFYVRLRAVKMAERSKTRQTQGDMGANTLPSIKW